MEVIPALLMLYGLLWLAVKLVESTKPPPDTFEEWWELQDKKGRKRK